MSTKELQEKAAAYFAENKNTEVYATKDGQLFGNKCFADLHAKSIKSDVITISKGKVKELTGKEKAAAEKVAKAAAEKAAAEEVAKAAADKAAAEKVAKAAKKTKSSKK